MSFLVSEVFQKYKKTSPFCSIGSAEPVWGKFNPVLSWSWTRLLEQENAALNKRGFARDFVVGSLVKESPSQLSHSVCIDAMRSDHVSNELFHAKQSLDFLPKVSVQPCDAEKAYIGTKGSFSKVPRKSPNRQNLENYTTGNAG